LIRRLWTIARREPLAHFALAGGVLFAVDAARAGWLNRERITVAASTVQDLVHRREQVLGRALSEVERREVLRRTVDDEILVREAYARGLDRQDGAIRQRLLEVMRFIMADEPPEPDVEQLRTFLEQHQAVYRTPRTISFSHVFVGGDGEGAAVSTANLLAQLAAGADFRTMGEDFWLGHVLDRYSEESLEQLLGSDFTRALDAMPLHRWAGPLASTQGMHLVRVDGRFPSELPRFEQLVPTLRTDWLSAQREALLADKLEPLRKRYRVRVEGTSITNGSHLP